jgi:hypothetical protein
MFAVAYRVVHGEPDLSQVPAALRPLISACLAKDPAARPPVGQLMDDVAASASAYPQVTPGKFWPDRVSALLESSEYTPVLPPPPATPATPAPASYSPADAPSAARGAGATQGSGATQAAGPALATEAARGSRPATDTEVRVPAWRRGPRWLLPSLLGLAVAAGAGVAIALALSPSPKPPAFLGSSASSASGGTAGAGAAVTVCTDPLGGCTDSGTGTDMKVQPAEIKLTADGSQLAGGLTWTGWGSQQATATGFVRLSGSPEQAATLTVSGLTRFGGSGSTRQAYSSIIVKTATKNYSFTSHTVPS